MGPVPVESHPSAIEEAREARLWYAERNAAVGERFLSELDRAVERIGAAPDRWPAYQHGTRKGRLGTFPYLIIDELTDDAARIVAVAHARRKPGYWKDRMGS